MSEIKVDTLTGKTSAGDITVTSEGGSATQSLQEGLMKSWVNIDIAGTVSVNDSLNVGSIIDGGAGVFNVVLSNNMNNNTYSSVGVVDGTGLTINCHTCQTDGRTTSQYRAYTFNGSGSATDYTCLLYQTAGDLA
jgi:hypothetical protein